MALTQRPSLELAHPTPRHRALAGGALLREAERSSVKAGPRCTPRRALALSNSRAGADGSARGSRSPGGARRRQLSAVPGHSECSSCTGGVSARGAAACRQNLSRGAGPAVDHAAAGATTGVCPWTLRSAGSASGTAAPRPLRTCAMAQPRRRPWQRRWQRCGHGQNSQHRPAGPHRRGQDQFGPGHAGRPGQGRQTPESPLPVPSVDGTIGRAGG